MNKSKLVKPKSNTSEIKKKTRDQFMVVIEKIGDEIKLIAEGQISLREEIMERFDNLDDEFKELDSRLELFKIETRNNLDVISLRLEKFERQTGDNFKSVSEYLFKLEQDFMDLKEKLSNSKIDKKSKECISIETRMLNFEKELEKMKIALKLKTA